MNPKEPERLTSEEYMGSVSMRLFRQTIKGPVTVHWHEFYELTFVLSGEGKHLLNGAAYPLVQGNLFLLTPGDFHELTPKPGTCLELYNLIFADEILNEELNQLLFDNLPERVAIFEGPEFTTIKNSFDLIWAEMDLARPGHRLIIRSEIIRLLVELVRKCQVTLPQSARADQPQAIRQALTYLHHHFRESLALKDIAGQVRLSPNYFSESFTRVTGVSFQIYLINLRLRFAASLLRVSRLKVTDICYAAGFNTLSHFERLFKQKYQVSPQAYRRNPLVLQPEDTPPLSEVTQSAGMSPTL
jgi:AraC-like DNA-binding protein